MEIALHTFNGLQRRLIDHLRHRIRNGEITERGLARMTGISQPHIHNALKGVRSISREMADIVMTTLRISALDLIPRDEITDYLTRTSGHRPSRMQAVPVLNGLLGIDEPLPRKGAQREVQAVPYHLTEASTDPLVATLAADPEMEPLFAGRDMVLLDQSEIARALAQTEGYYLVRTNTGPCVRGIRREGDTLFLISEKNRSTPAAWDRIELGGRNILDIVIARIIWLNRRSRWEDHVA